MVDFYSIIREVWERERKSWATDILFIFLFVLSLPYGMAVAFRNLLYDRGIIRQKKLPCHVISVGNIAAGGTGKTPAVIMLAKMLKGEGCRPVVLSRGYGGKRKKDVNIVSDGRTILMSNNEAGDEPFLIAATLKEIPVITGRRRHLTGSFAIKEFGADVLVLDDGFQHRALYRDMDIVLADSAAPFGNSRLLPCGNLRESPIYLKRADIVVLTGSSPGKEIETLPMLGSFPVGDWRVFCTCHKPLRVMRANGGDIRPPDFLRGKKLFAFAGIGNPRSFIRTIEALKADLVAFLSFPDHHVFTRGDLETIRKQARKQQADLILTTEKDGVRLLDFPDFLWEIFLLCIEMSFVPDGDGEAFKRLILQKLKRECFTQLGK